MQFASDFFLSRPTLDSYIQKFENDLPLPQRRYQIIFDELFSKDLSNDKFDGLYSKYINLLQRDRMMSLTHIDTISTDRIMHVFRELKRSVQFDGGNDLLSFIEFVVRSYQNDKKVQILVKYFSYLNSLNEYSPTQEEIIYMSNLYHVFNSIDGSDHRLLSDKYIQEFISKKHTLIENKERKKTKLIEDINSIIRDYFESSGNDIPDNLSDKEAMKYVLERIKK